MIKYIKSLFNIDDDGKVKGVSGPVYLLVDKIKTNPAIITFEEPNDEEGFFIDYSFEIRSLNLKGSYREFKDDWFGSDFISIKDIHFTYQETEYILKHLESMLRVREARYNKLISLRKQRIEKRNRSEIQMRLEKL